MVREYSPSAADLDKVTRPNGSGRQPVVFVYGLWLLDSSWNHWVPFFGQAGYSAVAPSWPDDPPTVELAREDRQRDLQGAEQEPWRHRSR
jgi:non-heme chloroperoxidase